MRLTTFELNTIKNSIGNYFNDTIIYLFGSRVDDSKKGGDIDLYILLDKKPHFLDKPRLLALMKKTLGEQKIDLLLSYPNKTKSLIDNEAISKGVLI